ncbi:MAG TPA: hypothetical protein VKQ30_22075 [Ktedonobacterales bacterium]|nr:hypothetical protein [Ktedonobacterales bacterium]
MTTNDSNESTESHVNGDSGGHDITQSDELLAALLRDLDQLATYLTERGRHTYELAQRFMEHARKDGSSRSYDERQAAMLEYQHYIWHEIAGLVNKLLVTYGADAPEEEPGSDATAAHGGH